MPEIRWFQSPLLHAGKLGVMDFGHNVCTDSVRSRIHSVSSTFKASAMPHPTTLVYSMNAWCPGEYNKRILIAIMNTLVDFRYGTYDQVGGGKP